VKTLAASEAEIGVWVQAPGTFLGGGLGWYPQKNV